MASEETAKRRRWLQFHLSTLLVLVLVAAAMLFANVRPRPLAIQVFGSYRFADHLHVDAHVLSEEEARDPTEPRQPAEELGWPFGWWRKAPGFGHPKCYWDEFSSKRLAWSVCACLAVLGFVGVLVEWLSRRWSRT